jgi:tRNA(fMet)-specific endonuclease VapC
VSLYLLDTDHFSLLVNGHPRLIQRLAQQSAHQFCLSVITVEESLSGWQYAIRQAGTDAMRVNAYRRMAITAGELAN